MSIEEGSLFRHDFGPRHNHLQEGVRPALVVQTNVLNTLEGYPNVIVVPLTTKPRPSPTYVPIQPSKENGLSSMSWAITNQIFTIGKADLGEFLGKINKTDLFEVKEGLKIAMAIS